MNRNDFYNAMAVITDIRQTIHKFYTMRVWARLGEVEATYSFENVTVAEAYDLYRTVYDTMKAQILAGSARVFLDPQPLGRRK